MTLVSKDQEIVFSCKKENDSSYSLENVEKLEAEMLQYEQAEIKLNHIFGPGVYIREIVMPKGVFAIGHAHKHDCINIVLKGKVSVFIDGKIKEILGPCTFLGKAMDRKVGYVHEETIWQTVHPTFETDVSKLEDDLLIKSESFNRIHELLLSGDLIPKQLKYEDVLTLLGETEQSVKTTSENEFDLIPMPDEFLGNLEVNKSVISGMGVFALKYFVNGSLVAPARIGLMRTPAGRYTNHSESPNCEMVLRENGNIDLVAIKNIASNEECTVNYYIARQVGHSADTKYLTN